MLDIRFARSGDVQVAYHVVGDGPVDIVYVQGRGLTGKLSGSFRRIGGSVSFWVNSLA
jgi:hypothetical protein